MALLDNRGDQRLGEALRRSLHPGAKLSIMAACFSLFAYGELKDELSQVDSLRFVFTEPTFVDSMAASMDPREFEVRRRRRERAVGGSGLELTLRNNLDQRALARERADWLRAKARAKSATGETALNYGSQYIVEGSQGAETAFMGMDNPFTLEGLGFKQAPNTLTSIMQTDAPAQAQLYQAQFDQVWENEALLADVTDRLIEQVGTLYRENSPELVYYLTLYHVFRGFLEEAEPLKQGIRFEETEVWNRLYDFQRDGVVGCIRKLERYKGCILADSVGLGKTFEALAVIKYYDLLNERALVLCPKRLRENWTVYKANDVRNILAGDRLSYDVLNHTDLSRKVGYSGDVNLERVNWGNYGLVVIDESHNFRNRSTDRDRGGSRYRRLMDDVMKAGRRTRVLMLSATPVNNRLLDLRNQIDLIAEDRDDYLADDGIPSIEQVTRRAQAAFTEWGRRPAEERSVQAFIDALDADYFKLLDALTIARSRRHITKYYGGGVSEFPERLAPDSLKPGVDLAGELPDMASLNDLIASLKFAQYQLLSFVRPDRVGKYVETFEDDWGRDYSAQVNRSNAVVNLMRVNVLKRLESSVASFTLTLGRVLEAVRECRSALDRAVAGA